MRGLHKGKGKATSTTTGTFSIQFRHIRLAHKHTADGTCLRLTLFDKAARSYTNRFTRRHVSVTHCFLCLAASGVSFLKVLTQSHQENASLPAIIQSGTNERKEATGTHATVGLGVEEAVWLSFQNLSCIVPFPAGSTSLHDVLQCAGVVVGIGIMATGIFPC